MTDAGCPINPSSIWKIEKAERRRINLDEAYALARVLGISLDQLITPIGVVSEQEIARLLREAEDQANEFVDLFERMATTVNQLKVAAGEAVEAGESRVVALSRRAVFDYLTKIAGDLPERSQ